MATLIESTLAAGTAADELADIAERVTKSVVLIGHRGGNGAGVIWRSDGQIVTNSHVASGDRADVVLADGPKFAGVVTVRHRTRDLAIVKIDADDLPEIEVGDSSTVRPGQLAFAVGHPFGLRNAVTAGIVVAAGQALTEVGPQTGDHLQADVALGPGNSGGPLVDASGRVIGINTMVAGRLSLAIPSQAVERFVSGAAAGEGGVYLGVVGVLVELRRPDQEIGFLLTQIDDGTPADRAGLILGDIVIAIGETAVTDQESVPAAVLRLKAGEAVTVRVLRGGERREFVVVPTERA
jgi:serine protease Do